jgi:nicotinate-nucleotide pyrophosphorylase (carboxylating)
MNRLKVRTLLEQFFLEDIGERDITSESLFPTELRGEGHFLVKAGGILAGIDLIMQGYKLLDSSCEVILYKKDGDHVVSGDIIAKVYGPMGVLLTGERVILNLLQRMSGIATITNNAVTALQSNHTKICDTRKTTPGLRMLEKYAVTCGGGYNHRYGLYDGVMIKDNHIAFAGSITSAVESIRAKVGHMVKIEVETESREAIEEAIIAGADVIMFDNRTPAEVKEFVSLVPKSIVTEASGGITLENLAEYGKTGVDYISLGLLTHSIKALDISFNVTEKGPTR